MTYSIVDELEAIVKEKESTPARLALAWVRAKAGVTSILIGARCLDQLEYNVKGTDIRLTADQVDRPDRLTAPKLAFPQNMAPWFPAVHSGGTTVNRGCRSAALLVGYR